MARLTARQRARRDPKAEQARRTVTLAYLGGLQSMCIAQAIARRTNLPLYEYWYVFREDASGKTLFWRPKTLKKKRGSWGDFDEPCVLMSRAVGKREWLLARESLEDEPQRCHWMRVFVYPRKA